MHRLTLISLGKFGTPVGIYFSLGKANEMLSILDGDNPDEDPDKTPHLDYIMTENVSGTIRETLKLTPYQAMVRGIEKASQLSLCLLDADPTKHIGDEDEIIRECVYLFLAAYIKNDIFSKLDYFLIKEA